MQYASNAADLPTRAQVRRWVRAALDADATVNVRFVDAIEGRALNAEYRGKDYATNVLTFVYDDEDPRAGDIVLCVPVLRQEAAAQGKTFAAHCAHLVVHGTLHMQGYDHERAADAKAMEGARDHDPRGIRHRRSVCRASCRSIANPTRTATGRR